MGVTEAAKGCGNMAVFSPNEDPSKTGSNILKNSQNLILSEQRDEVGHPGGVRFFRFSTAEWAPLLSLLHSGYGPTFISTQRGGAQYFHSSTSGAPYLRFFTAGRGTHFSFFHTRAGPTYSVSLQRGGTFIFSQRGGTPNCNFLTSRRASNLRKSVFKNNNS